MKTMNKSIMKYDDIVRHFLSGTKELYGSSHHLRRLFIVDSTLYSYGTHYPLGRIVTVGSNKIVLINDDGYSPTTTTHQTALRHGCIDVKLPYAYVSRANPEGAKAQLELNIKRMTEFKGKLSRAKTESSLNGIKSDMVQLKAQNTLLKYVSERLN